jgi:hypothetical protein
MEPNALLRTTCRINAAATLVCGAVLLIGGGALSPVFGAPTAALATVGGLFVIFAGWIWIISRRRQLFWNEAAAVGLLDATCAAASLAALAAFGTRMTLELKIAIALVAAPLALFAAVELFSASGPPSFPPGTPPSLPSMMRRSPPGAAPGNRLEDRLMEGELRLPFMLGEVHRHDCLSRPSESGDDRLVG